MVQLEARGPRTAGLGTHGRLGRQIAAIASRRVARRYPRSRPVGVSPRSGCTPSGSSRQASLRSRERVAASPFAPRSPQRRRTGPGARSSRSRRRRGGRGRCGCPAAVARRDRRPRPARLALRPPVSPARPSPHRHGQRWPAGVTRRRRHDRRACRGAPAWTRPQDIVAPLAPRQVRPRGDGRRGGCAFRTSTARRRGGSTGSGVILDKSVITSGCFPPARREQPPESGGEDR